MGLGKELCGHCGLRRTKEGHDGCLGTLIGVMNACCWHGKSNGYVQFLDGTTLQGPDADSVLKILKRNSEGYTCDPARYVVIKGERVKIYKNRIWVEKTGLK